MERRLAAIFAADMVGYSRLMEADEVGTIERLMANRAELVDPAIASHNGRIVKLMGDGMLVEFASVVDALQCAVAIQRAMVGRENHLPEQDRVRYRIGINVGDIMIEDGDIFGDGVNIAARLEAMAEPGGVCISGTAYDQIKSKVGVGYESLGDVQVKNIQQPVRSPGTATRCGLDASGQAWRRRAALCQCQRRCRAGCVLGLADPEPHRHAVGGLWPRGGIQQFLLCLQRESRHRLAG